MFCKSIYFSCSLLFFIQEKLNEKCQFIVLVKFMLLKKKITRLREIEKRIETPQQRTQHIHKREEKNYINSMSDCY